MIPFCVIDKYITLHTHIRKSETNIIIINLIVKKIQNKQAKEYKTIHYIIVYTKE